MKKIIVILCMLVVNSAFAAINGAIPEKLSLNVSLNFKQRDPNGTFNEYLLENSFKTAVSNHQWLTIQNNTESTSDQFILLGKIEDADAQKITMKFLVLDTGSNPGIVSAPKMTMLYGQKGQIVIDNKNQKIHLTLVAEAK